MQLVNHHIRELLGRSYELGASDVLLVAGAPPTMFIGGAWQAMGDMVLSGEEVERVIAPILSDTQTARLHSVRDLDLGYTIEGVGRFRLNVHFQRGTLAVAIRAIPTKVPSFEELALPEQVRGFADYPNGLVLVTGPTGQGKSTTLAALVDHINCTRKAHVVTIEDPVEFSFSHGTCLIEQRQIGDDSPSFASALKHVLRQRPDVILIGEMRDLETISTALTAAETGHLVLASVHTAGTAQTLSRVIDVFPPAQQPYVRTQVAASLKAIVCQTLLRDRMSERLTPATEILLATPAVRRAIRDNETHLIYGMLETGKRLGMHTLEQSLADLVRDGRVAPEDALASAGDPSRLRKLLGIGAACEPGTTPGRFDSGRSDDPSSPTRKHAMAVAPSWIAEEME